MSLIRLRDVTKRYDDRLILHHVNFRLRRGERVGLIGKNGSGKTTLLKLILGQEEPTEGVSERNDGVRIGYFSQFSELSEDASIRQVLEDVFFRERALEEELLEIEIALEECDAAENRITRLLKRQDEILLEIETLDGWTYPQRINAVLGKLGFRAEDQTKPIRELSGGWRNRASLAKILLEKPDVLLMDEPTNYLDLEGLSWLENWFRQFRGALLLVTHDRHFLDQVVTRIVEVENLQLQEYPGDFSAYVREKKDRMKSLEKQFQHEEELLIFESEAIADRKEARKNPNRSLARKLADMKKRKEPRPTDRILTGIYEGLRVGERLCRVEGVSKSYGERSLFRPLSFEIHKTDRLAVIGPNGCGKSTLLKILTGREDSDSGRLVWEHGVAFADFNRTMEELDLNDTVTHAVNFIGMAYHAPRKQVNRFLTLLQFNEMDIQQKIGTLSGGQKARVALALCLLSGAGALILDEPTNHLDLTSAQVMERALYHFPGAVVVVSHDRFFLDKIANRLLVFEENGFIRQINGNWTTWRASLDDAGEEENLFFEESESPLIRR